MEHDVFLSFRGPDTREDFIGHLCRALRVRGIETFIDTDGIERGSELSQALREAIEKSRMAVVVFSPGYATSPWCLNELVHIVERMKTKGLLVHPVFRGIEPSEAQNLDDGCYREALARYEKRFENNTVKVKRWELAVHEVTRLPGSHWKNGSQADFIQGVVEKVSQKLNSESSLHLSGQPELQRLLNTGSHLQVVGRTLVKEREAKRIKVLQAPTIPSSSQKESGVQQNEGFKTVLPPLAGSSSKYRGKFQQHGEPGMKEIESIVNEAQAKLATAQRNQIWTDMRFAQLVESSANQQHEELGMNEIGSIVNEAQAKATAQRNQIWKEKRFAQLVESSANQQHEELGMNEIESIVNETQAKATAQRNQIWTDMKFAQLVESSANQQHEELGMNEIGSIVNEARAKATAQRNQIWTEKRLAQLVESSANQQHEELGMNEIESIVNEAQAKATAQRDQIWTEIRFAQLVESSANQGSKSETRSTDTLK